VGRLSEWFWFKKQQADVGHKNQSLLHQILPLQPSLFPFRTSKRKYLCSFKDSIISQNAQMVICLYCTSLHIVLQAKEKYMFFQRLIISQGDQIVLYLYCPSLHIDSASTLLSSGTHLGASIYYLSIGGCPIVGN